MRLNVLLFTLLSIALAGILSAKNVQEDLLQLTYGSPDKVVAIHGSDLSPISHSKRDHFTLIVVTSTDEKHDCSACLRLKEVLRRTAKVWFDNYPFSDLLYFAEIDLVDPTNIEMFKDMKFSEVPLVWLVPPSKVTEKYTSSTPKKLDEFGEEIFGNLDILYQPHAEFRLPAAKLDLQVYEMADWLAKMLQKPITIQQGNPKLMFVATFVATFSLIILVKKRGPTFITGFFSKYKIYLLVSIVSVFVLLGGMLYSKIQGVPFIGLNDKKEAIYISGGTHYQFGVEVFVVAAVYGLLVANTVVLLYLGNYQVSETSVLRTEQLKTAAVLLAAGSLYAGYSLYLSIYLRKDGGYPYHMWKLV